MSLNLNEIRDAARGQWCRILQAAGMSPELLDHRGQPCPKCGGDDRYNAEKEVNDTGTAFCRGCFNKSSHITPRDGIATVAWWNGWEYIEAARWVADQVGIKGTKGTRRPSGTFSNATGDQEKTKQKTVGKAVAHYNYLDEEKANVFQVVRYEPKEFRQRKPDRNGGWIWKVKGVRQIPYRLPELLDNPNRPVVIAEGEKDVDKLYSIGFLATCNAGGAGKWTNDHASHMEGRAVVILPDNDQAGRDHAEQVARSLHGIAKSIRIVELPDLPEKGDPYDWIKAGGTKEKLHKLCQQANIWDPSKPKAWPNIENFENANLPPFPTQSLPDVLRDFVQAQSHATQTPADLAGLLTLAVCSAAISRRVEVEARPGWKEPVNLWVAVLMEPGNRKTGVFKEVMHPLRELEAEMTEEKRPDIARKQSERRQKEKRLAKLEKDAVEIRDFTKQVDASNDAAELAAELAKEPEPVLPRLIVDDATSEKLAIILEQQGGRIASMSPEGGVFDLMAGMYSKSGMPQFGVYLMGHSGDDLTTDRVGRKSVHVERPALTCAYAIQSNVIEGLAEQSAFRGRGLLARFLYATPESWIGQRKIAPDPVPPETRQPYHEVVKKLAQFDGELTISLDPEASRVFIEWEAEIEQMLDDGGDMELTRDWGAKLAGATLRFAAVLHAVEIGLTGTINTQTVQAAINLAAYLIPHAESVLEMMAAKEKNAERDAQYVLRWILRHQATEFTKRDAQQHGKRRFPKADDINKSLTELNNRGFIRPKVEENPSGPGRPPSPAYEVNPAVFENRRPRNSSQYSQKENGE